MYKNEIFDKIVGRQAAKRTVGRLNRTRDKNKAVIALERSHGCVINQHVDYIFTESAIRLRSNYQPLNRLSSLYLAASSTRN